MKLRIILILFILLTQFTTELKSQHRVMHYNSMVYSAENEIIAENYCEAAKIYHQIALDHYLFNLDIHNALLCALECDNLHLIELFAHIILERGGPIDYFVSNFSDYNFFSSQNWKELMSSKIDFTYNVEIRIKISDMIKIDQQNRKNASDYIMDDFLNLQSLDILVEKYGFPSEQDLGFDYLGESGRVEYNSWFHTIMLHLTKLLPWNFGELLPELYFKGSISKSLYIKLYPNIKFCDKSQITCLPSPSTNFLMLDNVLLSCDDELKIYINRNREVYFLDKIEDQLKKSIFRMDSDRPWLIGEKFSVFEFNRDYRSLEDRISDFKENGLIPIHYKN